MLRFNVLGPLECSPVTARSTRPAAPFRPLPGRPRCGRRVPGRSRPRGRRPVAQQLGAIALRARFGADLTIIANYGFLGGFGRASTALGDPTNGVYISGAYVSDPAKQLPPTGRRFVREFSATQPAHVINAFTPYAAQATEVLLSAIAHSDGTRASVVSQLQRVKVNDGILGSFGFDGNGDMTTNLMPVFRVPESAGEPPPGLALPSGYYPVYTVIHVSG